MSTNAYRMDGIENKKKNVRVPTQQLLDNYYSSFVECTNKFYISHLSAIHSRLQNIYN